MITDGWLITLLFVIIILLLRGHPITQKVRVKWKALVNGSKRKELTIDTTDLEVGSASPGQITLRGRRKTVGIQIGSETPRRSILMCHSPLVGTPSFDSLERELKKIQQIQLLAEEARSQTLVTCKMLEVEIQQALCTGDANTPHTQALLVHKNRLLQQQSEQLQTTVDLHLQQQEILSRLAARHTTPLSEDTTPQKPCSPLDTLKDDVSAGSTVPQGPGSVQGRQLLFTRTKSDLRSDHLQNREKYPAPLQALTPTVSGSAHDFPVPKVPRRMSMRGSPRAKNANTAKWIRGDLIGKGGFGTVHIAMDLVDGGKMVAVKNVPIGMHEPADKRNAKLASLKTEIELMKKLSHPNIVRYKGAEREGDSLNIFMEYVSGGSIAGLLKMFGPLTEDVAIAYTYQVLNGLKYLHESGVIHRDIKGANILLTVDGVCKLADFGAATLLGIDVHTSFVGTPNWMPPEIIRQEGHTFSADVWSLGCTVMEMLTGEAPWSGIAENASTMRILHYITSDSDFESEIRRAMEGCCDERGVSFVMSCIQADPSQRPDVTDLVEHEWMAILEEPEDDVGCLETTHEWKLNAQQRADRLKESLGVGGGAASPPSPTIASFPVNIRRPPDFRNSHSPENHNNPPMNSHTVLLPPPVRFEQVESQETLESAAEEPERVLGPLRSPIRGPGAAPSPQGMYVMPTIKRVSVNPPLEDEEPCFFTPGNHVVVVPP